MKKLFKKITPFFLIPIVLTSCAAPSNESSNVRMEKIQTSDNVLLNAKDVKILSFSDVITGNAISPPSVKVGNYANKLDVFEATGVLKYVVFERANIRELPDPSSQIVGELKQDESIYEVSVGGGWSKVKLPNGDYGFILENLLSLEKFDSVKGTIERREIPSDESFEPIEKTYYSLFSGLFLRDEPSPMSESVEQLYYGDDINIIGIEPSGWAKVEGLDGSILFVHTDFLSDEPLEIGGELEHQDVAQVYNYNNVYIPYPEEVMGTNYIPPVSGAGANGVVSTALGYLGFPYIWGAAGPSSFDCSGFTSYIYSLHGVGIGRTTGEQAYAGVGVPFSYKAYGNLLPGDLLVFAEGGATFHVGLYIGGGQMIHAGNSSTGVIVDDLYLDYYANRLAYVRRIF